MRYTKGKIGRVFVLKFDGDDCLLDELSKFIKKEKVKSAAMIFIGALKKGDLVTGPKKCAIPPVPNKVAFKDGWEVLGIGTVFPGEKGPQMHIHGAMGKKNKTLTGCVRGKSKVFLVIEAVLFELEGVKAVKSIDKELGINLLKVF